MKSTMRFPEFNLKKYYTIFLETGMIITLLMLITGAHLTIKPKPEKINYGQVQEVVKMEDVIQTKQQMAPPPPVHPMVPVAVPNDEIIQDEAINLDADLKLDEALTIPEPSTQRPVVKKENDNDQFFVVVEQMPKLIGTIADIQKKIVYPGKAIAAGIQGRVIVQFIIDKEGNVTNPHIIRGIGGGCDEEALRVVQEAKFVPGRQRGVPVRVQYSIPIIFKLQDRNV